MNSPALRRRALALAALTACLAAHAQTRPEADDAPDDATLQTVTVSASADASAKGLSRAYAGGQVARGARVGLLGTQDAMDTPFSITSYTSELIADRQARSVGDVLQNDPGVRVARGFGNFQEAYFMRGFIVSSDDTAYNGLYGLLPRQYIAAELFERVEVLLVALLYLIEKDGRENPSNILGSLSHIALALGMVLLSTMENIRTDLINYLFGDILD